MPPQPSRAWEAAGGAAASPMIHAGQWGNPAQDGDHGALPVPGLASSSQGQPSSLWHEPTLCTPLQWYPGGAGVSLQPSLSLCHLCFAVTHGQVPAPRTIHYSHAPFLNIDAKSKLPACPSPALKCHRTQVNGGISAAARLNTTS